MRCSGFDLTQPPAANCGVTHTKRGAYNSKAFVRRAPCCTHARRDTSPHASLDRGGANITAKIRPKKIRTATSISCEQDAKTLASRATAGWGRGQGAPPHAASRRLYCPPRVVSPSRKPRARSSFLVEEGQGESCCQHPVRGAVRETQQELPPPQPLPQASRVVRRRAGCRGAACPDR